MPKSVLAIARRAIEGRKKISSWFMGQDYSVEDATHAYFITALEQICDDLERKTSQPTQPGYKKPEPTSEIYDANGNCLLDLRFLRSKSPRRVSKPAPYPRTQKLSISTLLKRRTRQQACPIAGLAERCYVPTKLMLESLTDSFQFNDLLVLFN